MTRLVLAGGGHSHIEVLRRFATNRPANLDLTVVSPSPQLIYTGMLPGLVAGIYRLDECVIDIERLANQAGGRWIGSVVTGIDSASKILHLANGSQLRYDFLSLNTGIVPPRCSTLGALSHTVAIKPMDEFFRWWEAFVAQAPSVFPLRIAIVGAGTGGVELALAMEHRLVNANQGRPFGEVFLVTDGDTIMPGHNRLVRHWLGCILKGRSIIVYTNSNVTSIEEKCLHTADGRTFFFDYAVWTTGAAPEPWVTHSGLTLDSRGFVAVNDHLQSLSHPEVFAAGDVATQAHAPRPKSGVFAVRQGPVLSENLRRAIEGGSPLRYRPQRQALALIGTGEPYAIASRGLFAAKGGWVWRWKEKLDRSFVAKYSSS